MESRGGEKRAVTTALLSVGEIKSVWQNLRGSTGSLCYEFEAKGMVWMGGGKDGSKQ